MRADDWPAVRAIYLEGIASGNATFETSRGRSIGSTLLDTLVQRSERVDIWTLQASIFPENDASVQIHIRSGFRIVGRRERIARQNGIWRDTLL
ncbi:MAG TPA: GNAT family N-acetyltransferase, partial [Thermoanaerobaculia bacterium]